jgi:peptidoglycan/LPS O-acetylase OafA/YrhL
VLSSYGAFSLAGAAILEVATVNEFFHSSSWVAIQPGWAISCGIAGTIFALAVAAATRRAGAAFAAGAIGLALVAAPAWTSLKDGEPWLAYALELSAMLCLVVSGMLDAARPRVVAGWIGISGVVAGITWAVKGSLLRRSVFLAAAGAATIMLATALNRLLPRSDQ